MATLLAWYGGQKQPVATELVVFSRASACVIVVPARATKAELRAADLLQSTLTKATGRAAADFPVTNRMPLYSRALVLAGQTVTQGQVADDGRQTTDSRERKVKGQDRELQEWVAWSAESGWLELKAYPAEAIEAAAAWFLEAQLGARWFMPGALGEHIPKRSELRLPLGEVIFRPSYISRNLAVGSGEGGREWGRRNRLRGWFTHHHAMSALFKPEDLKANPDLAPQISGKRYIPADAGQQGWQPNLLNPAAAEHAARRLKERAEFSSALGMNDGIGYDQSDETRRFLGEPKWFRLRPDFSPLVFRFTNEVAKRMPERYLGAYAYYWTEDTPSFPVERNVVPYLTADRSEWLDADFAEADKALIKRWVAAGPEVVGLYDYYYGAPFFVPRPTLYAATAVIPFAREMGVKAFYAEIYPNWALDGPKAWVAAQLLWDSRANPEALLNTYYSEFWREAAAPMREFYALCDEQWCHQPKPTYWIKYYKDEHQYLLFPREVRQRLRALLERAMAGATTELTRNRLRFVSAGYAVTEAFCTWNETRDRLSRAALGQDIRPDEVRALIKDYGAQLDSLRQLLAETKRQYPDAIQADLLGEYTRNDPRRRAEWRLAAQRAKREGQSDQNGRQTADRKTKPETGDLKPEAGRIQSSNPQTLKSSNPSAADPHPLTPSHPHTLADGRSPAVGPELLKDAKLEDLVVGSTSGFFDLKWVQGGPWRGQGEPYQTRKVVKLTTDNRLLTTGDRSLTTNIGQPTTPITSLQSPVTSITFTGCKQDMLSQVVPGIAGRTYVARVKVQGKVSPGNMTFMILNFQDEQGRTLGLGTIDRLPVASYDEPVELVCTAVAPPEAVWVGMGVKTMNQVLDDEARFTGLSLREVLSP